MVVFQRAMDKYFGRNIVRLLSDGSPKKILIIKLWAIGDSIMTLPMIKGLRQAYPDAQIDVLARKRNKAVFENNEDIDNVLLFEPLQALKLIYKRYDLVIDTEPYLNLSAILAYFLGRIRIGFSHGIRSRLYDFTSDFSREQHMVKNYTDLLKTIGINYKADKLVKLESPLYDQLLVANELLQDISSDDLVIGICPGVAESVKARAWPIKSFIELIKLLIDKLRAKIVIVDSNNNRYLYTQIRHNVDDDTRGHIIDGVGRWNLNQVFSLIGRCKVFISSDTGPMHIAAAQGVKTIGLFGPNTPVLWAPYGKGNVSIYRPPKSGPFINNMFGYMPDKLTKDQENCMSQITVREVFNSVKKVLSEA